MRDPKEQYTFTNTTAGFAYPAGKAVAPGESIVLTVGECPEHAPKDSEDKEEKPKADPLAKLLKGTVAAVQAALPALSDETLGKLGDLEQTAKEPRKGVLGAIADQQLARSEYAGLPAEERDADLAEVLKQKPKDLAKHLPTMFTAALKDLAALEGKKPEPRSELIDQINQLVAARES